MASLTESCSNPLVSPITSTCLRTIFFSWGGGGMEASTATFCAAKIPLEIAISPRQQKNSRNWRKNLPQKTRAPDGFDILTNPQVRDRLELSEFSPAAFTVRFH